MVGDDTTGGSSSVRPRDRRRSRDYRDHIPYITKIVGRLYPSLNRLEFDEILATACVEADRLLREKFDPSKATATTFLESYLWGRLQYRLLVDLGFRKKATGWSSMEPLNDRPVFARTRFHQETIVDFEDLLRQAHPALSPIMRRLSEGENLEPIARSLLLETFDVPCKRWQVRTFCDLIRAAIRLEYERLTQ